MKRTDRHSPQATPTFDALARRYRLFIEPRGLGEVETRKVYRSDQSLIGKA